jgi:hypothetical protein
MFAQGTAKIGGLGQGGRFFRAHKNNRVGRHQRYHQVAVGTLRVVKAQFHRFVRRLGNMGETALNEGMTELAGQNANQSWGQGLLAVKILFKEL